jgi:hypothetical protein
MARAADWWLGGNGHVEQIGWTEPEDANEREERH